MITQLCSNCVNPVGFKDPNGQPITFFQDGSRILCQPCNDYLTHPVRPLYFYHEFDCYLMNHPKILFAYSGGLDSTVVLSELAKLHYQAKIELEIFTVETGFKGKLTWRNIRNIIDFLNLEKQYMIVDIVQRTEDQPFIVERFGLKTVEEIYRYCFIQHQLPCGKICNSMLDRTYIEIMQNKGYTELMTGGDTPKRGPNGDLSIFWHKNDALTIIRGGVLFGRTKLGNQRYVKNHDLPWVHPECGGYDTDCLVPGAFFANELSGVADISITDLVSKFPVIIEYLAERVRFGRYTRRQALRLLERVDLCSLSSYIEISQLIREGEDSR